MNAIDIVVGLQTPETTALRPDWAAKFFAGKFGAEGEAVEGTSLEGYINIMDRAGIERSLLFSPKAGPKQEATSYRPDPTIVADAVAAHPDRFSGLIGVDPTDPVAAVREIEWAVRELGFIGVHAYPHWFGLAPDHALWYPIYAKCVELNVPIQIQVGHCLLYTQEKPLRSVGRPITLDTVACDFPDLKLIGIHTGWPWTQEMISVAWKHPNVYIGTDAFAPRYWDKELVHFINSWGRDKVMFGTDFPVIHPETAMEQIAELGFREKSLENFLSGNAARVYGLD